MSRFSTVFLSLLCFTISLQLSAQTISGNFVYDGTNRNYVYHVSSSYNESSPAPLVLALHGLGDNGNNFMAGTGFNAISDTAGFIAVYPTALPDPILGGNGWNNGLNPLATANDIGFLNALLDTIIANYNIDETRIYATGFSMGGFMSHRVACDMNERIAAIAPVSGTMPGTIATSCDAATPVPVMHMHGTGDATVPYEGLVIPPIVEMSSVDFTIDFWVTQNGCDATPEISAVPDTESDGYTIDKFEYGTCDANSEVILLKINNGPHTWLYSPVNDIDASSEIWKFFLKHSKESNPSTGIADLTKDVANVWPNPFSSELSIELPNEGIQEMSLFDLSGKLMWTKSISNSNFSINTENLTSGMYILQLKAADIEYSTKLIKNYRSSPYFLSQ